jgi:hypothetical protein
VSCIARFCSSVCLSVVWIVGHNNPLLLKLPVREQLVAACCSGFARTIRRYRGKYSGRHQLNSRVALKRKSLLPG